MIGRMLSMIGKMLYVDGKEEHFVQKYPHQKMKPKGKMSSNLKMGGSQ
jgi:hypothetical protein